MNAPAHFGSWSTLTEPPAPAHTCPGCDDAVDQPGLCHECAAEEEMDMTQEQLVAQFRETGLPVDVRHAGQTLHVRPVEDGTDRWCVTKELDGTESTVAICPSHDVAMDWAAANGAALTVSHEALSVHWCKPAQANLPMPAYYCRSCGLDRAEIVAQHEGRE